MGREFRIDCSHCLGAVEFKVEDVPDLEDFIDGECSKARSEGEDSADCDCDDAPSVDDQHLRQLAAAIERGDREDARHWLGKLADELGSAAREEIELGRFSPQARA